MRSPAVAGDRDDPDVFGAAIHPLWAVGDKPNGGYLLALLGRAARDVRARRCRRRGLGGACPPRSPTSGRPASAPPTVRTTLLRSGRTAAHVRAVLVARRTDDLVDAVFVLGELPDEPVGALRRHPALRRRRTPRTASA